MKKLILLLAFALLPTSLVAAPINVSTIAVASGTVTVTTATSHGLAANQGVCLSTPANVCTAVATVPSGTTFTFTQPSNTTVAACASSCGTVSSAMQAIVLASSSDAAHQTVTYLCWKTTTNPVPHTGATSAWIASAGSRGASAAETNALAAGNFIEEAVSTAFPSTFSGAQMEVFVQAECVSRQNAFAGQTQPAAYFGFTFDGSQWVKQ